MAIDNSRARVIHDVMRQCRNYFERGYLEDTFSISGGRLETSVFDKARYIGIQGSLYNDGVYDTKAGDFTLVDEVFEGRVWVLAPPAPFLALCDEIAAFNEKNPTGTTVSESFGAYSYTKATTGSGGIAAWVEHFGSRLNPYQKLMSEVML